MKILYLFKIIFEICNRLDTFSKIEFNLVFDWTNTVEFNWVFDCCYTITIQHIPLLHNITKTTLLHCNISHLRLSENNNINLETISFRQPSKARRSNSKSEPAFVKKTW